MQLRTLFSFLLLPLALSGGAQSQQLPPDAVRPEWRSRVPEVVYPDSDLVNLYYKTWATAAGRVRRGPAGLPASPYLDENCYDDQIWIWDTCFMTLFSKYCPSAFPGKETMLNLYVPLLDHRSTPLKIHLRDNPPLFAWVEEMYYRFTGDREQAEMVAVEKRYLQRHFDFFNNVPRGQIDTLVSPAYNPISRGVVHDEKGQLLGFTWRGGASGMDNTVRGRDAGGYGKILWIDAICQQALSALCISRLSAELGQKKEAHTWKMRYDSLRTTINKLYWDERDGFYYDISVDTHQPCRIKTPASFWALVAGIPDKRQAERMLKYLRDEKYMGGTYPWPSLSRDDKDFDGKTGEYWRGGVWIPMVYMGTKALENYGFYALADSLARRSLDQQLRTYLDYTPHTIWETYSPSANLPSTEYGKRVRQDFCGWSALGPISLFIENVLGFRDVNALTRTVRWDLNPDAGTQGLRRLQFGGITCSLIYDATRHVVETETNQPFTLNLRGKKLKVKPGKHTFKTSL